MTPSRPITVGATSPAVATGNGNPIHHNGRNNQ